MTRLVELLTIGLVAAVTLIAAAYAAGAGETISVGGWVAIGVGLIVVYAGAVEVIVRVVAREERRDGR